MIISKDIKAESNLYYLGAILIGIIDKHQPSSNKINLEPVKVDFFQAFQEMKQQEDISINSFILTIDWLFLLKIIKLNGKFIEKCS